MFYFGRRNEITKPNERTVYPLADLGEVAAIDGASRGGIVQGDRVARHEPCLPRAATPRAHHVLTHYAPLKGTRSPQLPAGAAAGGVCLLTGRAEAAERILLACYGQA